MTADWPVSRYVRITATMLMVVALCVAARHERDAPKCVGSGVAPTIATMAAEIDSELIPGHVTGIAAELVTADAVLSQCVAGVRGLGSTAAITAHTLFHAASISKTFVAAATLRLVQRGVLDLDAPVDRYLATFPPDRAPLITIRDLMQHTSGLADVTDYGWSAPDTLPGALQRNAAAIAGTLDTRTRDRKARYTNSGVDLLGAIIERVTATPFDQYLSNDILTPTGMKESFFRVGLRDTARLAYGHLSNAGVLGATGLVLMNERHAPSSTLNVSIEDLGKWLQLHLRRGRTATGALLPESVYPAMWDTTIHLTGGNGQTLDRSVGLGWLTGRRIGEFAVWHPGADHGYRSFMMILPEHGLGAAVLCNSDHCDPSGIVQRLLAAELARRRGGGE